MTVGYTWPAPPPLHLLVVEGRQDAQLIAVPCPPPSSELLPAGAKGLVFDLDGTVLDSMAHHWKAWETMTQEFGVSITAEQLLALAGKPSLAILELLCAEQGVTVDKEAAVRRKTDIYCQLAVETEIIEPVMEIARAAKARGLPCAIATGGSRRQVTKSLAAAGLDTFFGAAVVTADDVTHGKPHPETFLRAAELIGVPPAECVGYEDAPLGMEAIRAAGFLLAVDVTALPGYPSLLP